MNGNKDTIVLTFLFLSVRYCRRMERTGQQVVQDIENAWNHPSDSC